VGFFRFRRSIKILPGVRWNFGKRSSSVSFGGRGFHYTIGSTGRRTTIGIPGTGLSYTSLSRRSSSEKRGAAKWSASQQKTFHIELPDRQPGEPDATQRQLNYIRSMASIDEGVLVKLGRSQASAAIKLLKQERAALNSETSEGYVAVKKRSGCGCASAIILIVGIGAIVSWLNEPATNNSAPEPANPARTNAATPGLNVNVPPKPAAQLSRDSSTVEDAKTQAVRRYPDLGIAGTKMNLAFIARYNYYRRVNPDYFGDPRWPLHLADETSLMLTGTGSATP
jgi:hypothetical protein